MSSLREYRYDLLETVNKYSDDSNIDFRLLDHYISVYRVKWIELIYNKFNKQIPEVYYQTLKCVELELVDSIDCCEVSSDCKILRTVEPLPTMLSLMDGEMLAKVSAPDIVNSTPNTLFQIIKYEQAEFYGNGRYNSNRIGTFIYNNYLYFIINENSIYYNLLERINVRAIFQDPTDAARFKDCDGTVCWTPDSEYPLEPRIWTYIKQDILSNELRIKMSIPEDQINDNKDNTVPTNE